ncbi:response regulator [Candidatus Saccharibacteria bacterium]|nr:response regulator [Candidatus Saccharibacteria bacterium]
MPKILLVEDDISLRDVYFARLQADGYDLSVASNGEEALAMAVRVRPDLIVLDVMMPRISGFDVLDMIRTTPDLAHTKVIMMTALGSTTDRERGERLGVDKYLVKSQVTLEDVVLNIKKILNTPAASTGEKIVGAPEQAKTDKTEDTPPAPTPEA